MALKTKTESTLRHITADVSIELTTLTAGGGFEFLADIIRIPKTKFGRIAFLGASITYGLFDDPTDERVQWAIVRAPISQGGIAAGQLISDQNPLWRGIQIWRSINTDTGPVNLTTAVEIDGDPDAQYSSEMVGDGEGFMVIAESSQNSAVQFEAVLDFIETLIQTVYPTVSETEGFEEEELWMDSGFTL